VFPEHFQAEFSEVVSRPTVRPGCFFPSFLVEPKFCLSGLARVVTRAALPRSIIHRQEVKQTIWIAKSPVRSACGADSLSSWVWARASAFRSALADTSPASVQNNR
jgi:hypothetical protein